MVYGIWLNKLSFVVSIVMKYTLSNNKGKSFMFNFTSYEWRSSRLPSFYVAYIHLVITKVLS